MKKTAPRASALDEPKAMLAIEGLLIPALLILGFVFYLAISGIFNLSFIRSIQDELAYSNESPLNLLLSLAVIIVPILAVLFIVYKVWKKSSTK